MIAITGATGHLGQLVISHLLDRGVEAGGIVAIVRNAEKAAPLAEQGIDVRVADYTDPAALELALAGIERLLLISSSEVGQRATQHANVIDAAIAAGVGHVAYTSVLNAADTTMELASEHVATEGLIRASGIPFTFLRNGWYVENYTGQLGTVIEHGALLGAASDGVVAVASRSDYAAAAAVVLTTDGHADAAYELAGDTPVTLTEVAAALARATGEAIVYSNLPADAYEAALAGAGLPAPVAHMLADCDLAILRGELTTASGDLRRLIGRPTESLDAAVTAAVQQASVAH